MKSDRFENWLQKIMSTKEDEISCTECFDLVSHFIDLELSGENPAAEMPQLKQHLNQCTACRDEYEALRDLRRLEEQSGLPSLDDLQDLIH
jgi:hypothetical protein